MTRFPGWPSWFLFVFPMFTWRALDWLGREHTPFPAPKDLKPSFPHRSWV